jgi:hypothetical protein
MNCDLTSNVSCEYYVIYNKTNVYQTVTVTHREN